MWRCGMPLLARQILDQTDRFFPLLALDILLHGAAYGHGLRFWGRAHPDLAATFP
jgi:hypothetical protein